MTGGGVSKRMRRDVWSVGPTLGLEFLDVATGSPDLNESHQGFLRGFLRRADQVKFARHLPDANYIEEVLLAAGRFLEQTQPQTETSAKPGEVARA